MPDPASPPHRHRPRLRHDSQKGLFADAVGTRVEHPDVRLLRASRLDGRSGPPPHGLSPTFLGATEARDDDERIVGPLARELWGRALRRIALAARRRAGRR